MNKYQIIGLVVIFVAAVLGSAFYFKKTNNKPMSTTTDQTAQTPEPTPPPAETPTPTPTPTPTVPEKAVATIATSEGSFEVTLDGKAAPKTVANFIKLANQGFYNNLTFHRIVRDFVIQGGDPKGDGTGGPGYTIPAEIGLKHTKGAIAMARLGGAANPLKESSGSQFYIALQDLPSLDGEYTVFGYVTSGMDVVTKIGNVPTEPNPDSGEASVPIKDVVIKTVTIKQ
ncbi:MAG TPA: peptidylprolyl isomerase [Patescibacteria group bacterium]|jgi:cyclophilin family peptidyl-prolyl cis-trans isomerase|nr:peptidylprolyl isomerase [Patescibacteria group bacterium]